MAKRPHKALIIGAGIAGPVTAIFLKKAGIDAEVFEAWPYATGIGGGLQIAPNGMHVLAEMGLADELIRRGSIAESFDFYSQSGARLGSLNQQHAGAFRPARGQHVPRHAQRDADQQGLVRECRAHVREAPGRASRIAPTSRWSRISPTAPRPKAISSSAPTACIRRVRAPRDPRWSKTVRHRPDRLWRFRAARGAGGHGRSASASRRPSAKAASSATAFAVPIPMTA